ncbi:MAG: 4a-hydroxytetrahydrobiopterin dehydratase [Myxococcales bacterium]
MTRPVKLDLETVGKFVSAHDGWHTDADALEKIFTFPTYGAGLAFAVHLGFAADKRDHHPELNIGWGKVGVRWTTHDAGGITALDLEMAEVADHAYGR